MPRFAGSKIFLKIPVVPDPLWSDVLKQGVQFSKIDPQGVGTTI